MRRFIHECRGDGVRIALLLLALFAAAIAGASAEDYYLVAREYTRTLPAEPAVDPLNFNDFVLESYGDGQDMSPTVTIEDGGHTLHIVGNGWKKIALPYVVTADTILEFDFKSTAEGDVHGVGFDTDNALSPLWHFKVYGTQTWGIQTHDDYPAGADVEGWTHYRINVGESFTGSMLYLTFSDDHDVAVPNAESYFRNVKVFDPVVEVAMWGFVEDADGDLGTIGTEVPTSPGPRLVVGDGVEDLRIFLRNDLATPVSIVIPGQALPAFAASSAPVWDDGTSGARTSPGQRVRSFTAETAPGTTLTYEWSAAQGNPLQPGTYLYQSGTDPAVQVQMGLYGAVTRDAGPWAAGLGREAYSGIYYEDEVLVFYSEIDPVLHQAIADGSYGTTGPMSAIDYRARYFLVNGEPFDRADPLAGALRGLRRNRDGLVRFLSASLETHVPMLQRLYMQVVAEDGHPYPYAREQYQLNLAPGKTMDALIRSPETGSFPLYDRRLALTNGAQSPGGMINFLYILLAGVLDLYDYEILPYGGTQDVSALATIEDAGATLHLAGNTWKKIQFPYEVTLSTVLEFDFRSSAEGEIHALGFDDDDTLSPAWAFQVHGTQVWGVQDFNDYPVGADADGWQHYVIPVGSYFTGAKSYLIFANDHDVASPTGEGQFRNIQVHE